MIHVKGLSNYKTYVKVGTSIRWREIYIVLLITFLKGIMSPIHLQNLILHKVSSTLCISSLLHFPLNSTLRMLEIREKLEWLDRATLLHLFLSPSLRCWLPSHGVLAAPCCPDGPLDHIRALLSSSMQFTLATSGWCRTVLLLHLWASCSPGSRK